MMFSKKEKLEAQFILEAMETDQTELGRYLAKAIKNSEKIPEELKQSFIIWVGMKEADVAYKRAYKKLSRYDSITLMLKKPWWKFW